MGRRSRFCLVATALTILAQSGRAATLSPRATIQSCVVKLVSYGVYIDSVVVRGIEGSLKYKKDLGRSYGARLLIQKAKEASPPQKWAGFLTEHKEDGRKFREAPFKKTGVALLDTIQLPVRGISYLATGKQYLFSPLNGPTRYLTRRYFKGEDFFQGEHQMSWPLWWSAVLFTPLPGPLQNAWDAIDPVFYLIKGLIFAKDTLDEKEEEQILELLIKHDPRFEEIRSKLKDGKVTATDKEKGKEKLEEIKKFYNILKLLKPLPVSHEDYIQAVKTINGDKSQKLSPQNEQLFARIQLLDHPFYSHLLNFEDPNWKEKWKASGFNVANANFETLDVTTLEGLKKMDALILARTHELADYDFLKELTKSSENPEELSKDPNALKAAEYIKKQDFYKYVYNLKETNVLNEGEMLETLLLWTNFRHKEKLNQALGVFQVDERGHAESLETVEAKMKMDLDAYILGKQASKN